MKIRFSTLLILLIISLMPQMTNVTGLSEPAVDPSNNLLESEEFVPYWEKLNLTVSPSSRRLSPLVYDSENKKTILFSGQDVDNDTWVFDSNTMKWTQMYPNNSPSSRQGHKMIFDPISKKTILFGGYDRSTGQNSKQTWAYDYATNNWTELTPTNSPSPRRYHTMVYDNTNNIVLMHGGYPDLEDTWSYNITSNKWTNMNITDGPGIRDGAYYSFDQDNGKFIVFGGFQGDVNTWAYDYKSNTWSNLSPTNEPATANRRSYGSNMFYNPIMKQSIFYGGYDSSGMKNDMWGFDYKENSWYQINSTNTPGGRWTHGMAYDSNARFTILFGGDMDETWILFLTQSDIQVENLPSNVNFNLGSDHKIVFNITTTNATTYEIYLNNEYKNSYQYLDNDTISLDLNDIYSNFTYSNYTILNNTKFEFTNLTLVFSNMQNDTYTHSINVKVFDKLPIIMDHDSINIDYEIGTSLPLEFQISDDNPDMIYIYKDNKLIYFNNWSNPHNTYLNANDFINSTNTLGNNYYKVIFEDKDNNQIEYNLQINIIDTINPVFTSIKADDYVEGEDFGIISFSIEDITLDRYAVVVNDAELENSTFDETSYIEVSNAGFLEGEYNVEIIVYDRGNNMVSFTTSFTVKTKDVTNNATLPSSTMTVTETNNITITETTQNGTNNVSIPEGAPISDLPLMLFVGISGLYILRRKNQALIKTQN